MDQAVNTANIDKGAEVGQVADDAGILVADFNGVPDLPFAFLALLLQEGPPGAGDPHTAAVGVELGDQDIKLLVPVGLKVINDR